VPAITPAGVVNLYLTGNTLPPHYIKIDLEGLESLVMENLFQNNIFPEYISCEFIKFDVLATLVASGKYKSFKLSDASPKNGAYTYSYDRKIHNSKNYVRSGRFSDDLGGSSLGADNFAKVLMLNGVTGIDIHASRDIKPDIDYLKTGYLIFKHFIILLNLLFVNPLFQVRRKIPPMGLRSKILYVFGPLFKRIS
jgi:hypothetical protein